MVVVALGEPGVPVCVWACAEAVTAMMATANIAYGRMCLDWFHVLVPLFLHLFFGGLTSHSKTVATKAAIARIFIFMLTGPRGSSLRESRTRAVY